MSISSEIEYDGFRISRSRWLRVLERLGGLVIRTNLVEESVRLLWRRPLVGWIWHWRTPAVAFTFQRKYEGQGWSEVTVWVDTRPERLR